MSTWQVTLYERQIMAMLKKGNFKKTRSLQKENKKMFYNNLFYQSSMPQHKVTRFVSSIGHTSYLLFLFLLSCLFKVIVVYPWRPRFSPSSPHSDPALIIRLSLRLLCLSLCLHRCQINQITS